MNKQFFRLRLVGGMLMLSLVSSACVNQFLDTAPKGILAEGALSGETVDKLVIAAYQALGAHFFGNDQSFAGPASNWIIDVMSDDALKGGGGIADRTDVHQLETMTHDPTSYPAFQKWRNNLFAIERCNLAIREIEKLDDPLYPKATRIAEMKALRSRFMIDLKLIFNQFPYLDESSDPSNTSNTEYTSEELWSKIEQDLLDAYNVLPATQPEVGRVNKYMTAALLAKLYIQTSQWQNVLTYTGFIRSGQFSLLPEFEDLTKLEFENGSESVFTIQYSTANIFANHDWSNLLNVTLGPGIDNGAYANGDDFYQGSQNLVNAFRVGPDGLPLFDTYDEVNVASGSFAGPLDPRVDFTFGRVGIPWKGTAVYDEAWIRSQDYLGYSSKKAVVAPDDPSVHNSFPWAASGLNFNIVRYAEVLLWEAEALIELNQNLDEARNLINQVRERAKNSTYVKRLDGSGDAANYSIELYPSSGWTQDYARQAVRFERRLELAMEGKRWFDLQRWGILDQTMNDYFQSESARLPYLQGITYTPGKNEHLPIPQGEIDLAPTLYSQNAGY